MRGMKNVTNLGTRVKDFVAIRAECAGIDDRPAAARDVARTSSGGPQEHKVGTDIEGAGPSDQHWCKKCLTFCPLDIIFLMSGGGPFCLALISGGAAS
ncbi:MAG: hypothetical protein ONB17_10170 [candidate division KSB1 bacterium]|nr:hypothetical protein [candidate division KSB1 bacterium]